MTGLNCNLYQYVYYYSGICFWWNSGGLEYFVVLIKFRIKIITPQTKCVIIDSVPYAVFICTYIRTYLLFLFQ